MWCKEAATAGLSLQPLAEAPLLRPLTAPPQPPTADSALRALAPNTIVGFIVTPCKVKSAASHSKTQSGFISSSIIGIHAYDLPDAKLEYRIAVRENRKPNAKGQITGFAMSPRLRANTRACTQRRKGSRRSQRKASPPRRTEATQAPLRIALLRLLF